MGKLALLFSGQGSQYVGMGLDYKSKLFGDAHHILGYCPKDVLEDQHQLDETLYAQPLIVLKSLLGLEALKDYVKYEGVLGFSLGEYSALYAAGVFSFEDLLKIVSIRANLMQEAALLHPGAMVAVIGLDEKGVEEVCVALQHKVMIANYNAPDQYVISGDKENIETAMSLLKEKGARRTVKLNVSGAFHSPLMAPVSDKLRKELDGFIAHKPQLPLYMNQTALPLEFKDLYGLMAAQISHPVQFIKSIKQMKRDGFTHFLEIGPGRTLSSFVKKIDADLEVMHFDKYAELDDVKGWLMKHGFSK